MDHLEDLDNKSLHAKCLEYGLPNIPITATSRKLLIKRLRAAMQNSSDGKHTDKKTDDKDLQKSRRETIHVSKTKAPSKERSKSPSRRKTIDATTVSVVPPSKSTPEPAQIMQRRRSGRVTPNAYTDSNQSEVIKTKMKTAPTIEEESNDVVMIEDDEEEETRSRPASRQSRASSLSTSPIVTTTYTQNVKEPILENQEEEFEEPRYTVQKSTYNYESRKSYIPTSSGLQREPLYSSRINQLPSRPTLTTTLPTITSYGSTVQSSNMNRRHTSITGTGTYDYTDYTGSSSIRPVTSPYRLVKEDSGDEIEKEAPYLSDFARKLSRLKAEPVDGGLSTLRKEVERRSTRLGGVDSRHDSSSIGESMKQLCVALDRKYGLKKKFYIAAGLMILVLAYMFIYQ